MTRGYIQYALHGEDRPRLLSIYNATDILVERWMLDLSDLLILMVLLVVNESRFELVKVHDEIQRIH